MVTDLLCHLAYNLKKNIAYYSSQILNAMLPEINTMQKFGLHKSMLYSQVI